MKVLSALCLFLFPLVTPAQWELTTAIKSRSRFPAVHMVDAQRGYAIDEVLNAILRTDDGGSSWQRMTTLAIDVPNALHMWDGQRGIVVGSGGSIHRTADGFSTFQSTTANLGSLYSVAFANDLLGLVGTGNGVIRRTTDGGDTWAQMTSGVGSSYAINDLAMPNADTAFAVAYGVGVLRSIDGGSTWASTGTPTGMRAMHFTDARNGIAVGNTGAILRTADAGNSWETIDGGATQNLLSITRQGNVVLVSSASGRILRSADGGSTWTVSTIGSNLQTHRSISLAADGSGIIGTDGRIYGTVNGGITWDLIKLGTYHTYLNKVSFANADTGVAVGYTTSGGMDDGTLRTVDGGRTWSNANANGGLGVHLRPDGVGIQGGSIGANARTTDFFATRQGQGAPNVAIRAAWTFGEFDHLVAGGYLNSGFYRTTNGGATWQHTPNGASSIFDLYFINDLVGFGVGVGGQIWKSSDAGNSWEQLPHSTANDQFSVFFLNEQIGWTVGANSGARTTDGGQTWTNMPDIPSYAMMVHFVDEHTGYVVGNSGQTVRSTDGGATWQPIMPGITNAIINDAAYLDGTLVLVGRFGDVYRAQVACPSAAEQATLALVGNNLCTSTTGSVQWFFNGELMDGESGSCISTTVPGQYHVVVTNALGCPGLPSLPVTVDCPAMPAPEVELQEDALCTDAEGDLQWFFNGEAIPGGTGTCIPATVPGDYHLVVTDGYGCPSAPSIMVTVDCPGLPAPTLDWSVPYLCAEGAINWQWYWQGELLPGETSACIDLVIPGNYHVVGSDANGCPTPPSDTMVFIGSSVPLTASAWPLTLAPNPVQDQVQVLGLDGRTAHVRIMDLQGRTVHEPGNITGAGTLAVGHLPPAPYLLRVTMADRTVTLRFVKQ